MKSKFWVYKEFQSKHFRKKNTNQKSKWIGPQFFEAEISEVEYRKHLRDVLGIKNSEHLEVKISEHKSRNSLAQKTALGYLNREISSGAGIYSRAIRSKRVNDRVLFVNAMLNYA